MKKNAKVVGILVCMLLITSSTIVAADWQNKGDYRDYGDAPEGSNAIAYPSLGVSGSFPTCQSCGPAGWIQHDNYGAWFGNGVDFEFDGNGGTCPGGFPPYDQDEGFQDGDAGLIMPEPFTIDATSSVIPFTGYTGTPLGNVGQTAVWGTNVDIWVDNHMPGHPEYLPGFVNVLIDWNQDGDWMDVGEHVLVDFVVPPLYLGPLSGLSPPSFTIAGPIPAPGYVWSRFSITESPVGTSWFGEGAFEDGESEDYLLFVDDQPSGPSVDIEKKVWNETLGDWDEYIEAEVCTIVRFNLSIYNNDTDSVIVTKIWDTLPPCVEYADNATFNGILLEPDVINLPTIEWNYPIPADYWYPGSAPGELPPGEWIFIEFDVHVIGPPCTDNVNWGYWDVYYNDEYYYFEDNATIHPISGEPWPNHKMHYPQLPDPNGWDVLANFEMPFMPLADDWMCSETGPVTDIHFWGSWLWDFEGVIDGFDISIWDDIPADQSPTGYSMPGTMLWNEYFSSYDIIPMDPSPQGWYDPYDGWFEPQGNHMNYWQYNIENISDSFIQQNGTIYWLCIRPSMMSYYPDPPLWGWKTSLDHFNDDAVYWLEPIGWMELYDPMTGLSLDLSFVITGEEEPCEPSIDVEKYVWDPLNEDWVDADDPSVAVDFTIGSIAQFKIAIHNDGECCNLTNIYVDDFAEEMNIVDFTIWPDGSSYTPGVGTSMWWTLPGPLSPCNWINITIWAEVEGTHCNTYYNWVEVDGYCEDQDVHVMDNDYCYIHAVELFEAEFGDAPEIGIAYPSTGVPGSFPTCMCCGPAGWVQHDSYLGGGLFFGNMKDNEIDGNAGWCTVGSFPPYDQDEGFFGGPDGGLMWPDPYTIDSTMNVVPLAGIGTPLGYMGQIANWGVEIDMFVQNWLPIDAYVNVLADWNQNGQWGDPGEHILIDFTIPAMWNGPISLLGPPSFTIGPNHGYVWARFTVSEYPVSSVYPIPWNGDGYFEDGETEDYLLRIDEGLPIASFDYEPLNPTTVDTVYFNSTSYDTNPGGSITNWTWNIGGTPKYGEFVTHQFTSDGTYTVTLTVMDNSGKTDSTAKLVPVGDITEITNLSQGWNIVSPPFNQSVSNTDLIIKYNGYYYSWSQATSSSNPTGSPIISQYIFGWDRSGQSYTFAYSLDPGEGYWVYSYQNDCEFWAINVSVSSDDYVTALKTGWNLMGVPDDSSVNKINLIVNYGGTDYTWSDAVTNGYINNIVFGWIRLSQSYNFATTLDPGYGYWMFAYYDCILKK